MNRKCLSDIFIEIVLKFLTNTIQVNFISKLNQLIIFVDLLKYSLEQKAYCMMSFVKYTKH